MRCNNFQKKKKERKEKVLATPFIIFIVETVFQNKINDKFSTKLNISYDFAVLT